MHFAEEFDMQKSKVISYIMYKKRTEYEVRQKFSSIIKSNMLEDIIEYIKQAGYLNDLEYIEKTIKDFTNLKNLSIKEVEYKLYSKGISKDLIEDYKYENIEELKEYEIKSAYQILLKKSTQNQEEVIQYLLKKGYKLDNIKEAIDRLY